MNNFKEGFFLNIYLLNTLNILIIKYEKRIPKQESTAHTFGTHFQFIQAIQSLNFYFRFRKYSIIYEWNFVLNLMLRRQYMPAIIYKSFIIFRYIERFCSQICRRNVLCLNPHCEYRPNSLLLL